MIGRHCGECWWCSCSTPECLRSPICPSCICSLPWGTRPPGQPWGTGTLPSLRVNSAHGSPAGTGGVTLVLALLVGSAAGRWVALPVLAVGGAAFGLFTASVFALVLAKVRGAAAGSVSGLDLRSRRLRHHCADHPVPPATRSAYVWAGSAHEEKVQDCVTTQDLNILLSVRHVKIDDEIGEPGGWDGHHC
jgi:hypothetical protein